MTRSTDQEANKERLMRLIEKGFNGGDLSVVDEVVSSDSKEHQRGNDDGAKGTKEVITTLRTWFPDFRMQLEDIAASEDRVWARFRATGTNLGQVMHIPPTGRKVSVDVIDIVRFRDGRIVEHWGVPDQLGLMIQIGAVKAEPPG